MTRVDLEVYPKKKQREREREKLQDTPNDIQSNVKVTEYVSHCTVRIYTNCEGAVFYTKCEMCLSRLSYAEAKKSMANVSGHRKKEKEREIERVKM